MIINPDFHTDYRISMVRAETVPGMGTVHYVHMYARGLRWTVGVEVDGQVGFCHDPNAPSPFAENPDLVVARPRGCSGVWETEHEVAADCARQFANMVQLHHDH